MFSHVSPHTFNKPTCSDKLWFWNFLWFSSKNHCNTNNDVRHLFHNANAWVLYADVQNEKCFKKCLYPLKHVKVKHVKKKLKKDFLQNILLLWPLCLFCAQKILHGFFYISTMRLHYLTAFYTCMKTKKKKFVHIG